MISIIGDVIIDEYIYGTSNRLSPEAPVPVVKFVRSETRPGGADNVYHNLKSLTDEVCLCSRSTNPPRKQRVICDGFYITRIDYNDDNVVWETSYDPKNTGLFVISDYNKGAVELPLHKDILSRHNIVDPKRHLSEYKGCWCLKPNKKEFEEYAGKWNNLDKLSVLMHKCRQNLSIEHLIVTLGSDGVALYNSEFYHTPAIKKESFDVTGAGDTFLAVLAFAIYDGNSMVDSINMANRAAAVAVSHKGTYIVKPNDIEKDLIVFTNGCFDILHAGHIEYLKKSKSLGNKLIVGLNSDESVRRIKGEGRPINNQFDRKRMLESLSFVDEVIIFNEDTPINLIKSIRPDIITKGGDYTEDQVVGNGISKVVIIPTVEGMSSTNIIKRMMK